MAVKKSSKLDISIPKIAEDKLELLKKEFPEIFTEGKIDVVKLKQTLGDFTDDSPERYLFSWAGRKDCIRLLQTPTQMTLTPDEKDSVDYSDSENLIIEGDNLEVLKLLYKSYFGKVKMIYIDPPYNTGNDFVYSDDFRDTKNAYLKQTGQMDENGNLQTTKADRNGHIHSSWLSMIYPRLFVARQLLRDDGVIFVSIDDNEVHNLRIVMNEIFGGENFIGQFVWKRRSGANDAKMNVSTDHEYVLAFMKNSSNYLIGLKKDFSNYKNPDNDSRGDWTTGDLTCNKTKSERPNLFYDITNPETNLNYECNPNRVWRFKKETMQELINAKKVIFPKNKNGTPMQKRFLTDVKSDYKPASTWIETNSGEHLSDDEVSQMNAPLNAVATKELRGLFEQTIMNYPKSYRLMQQFIEISTSDSDVVMDFFAGSGTTAQAVLEQNKEDNGNRKFILVQLPEPTPENSEARKSGYKTIADICKERVRRVIKKIKEEQKQEKLSEKQNLDLGFKVFKLKESNFKAWEGVKTKDPKEYIAQMQLFKDPIKPKTKTQDILWEVAIKEGYPFTVEINKIKDVKDNTVYKVEDKTKNQFFYICLDNKIVLNNLKPLNLKKENLFIARDIALNDEQQANLALQCNLKTL